MSSSNVFDVRLGRADDLAKAFGCSRADIYRRTRAGEFDSFLVRLGVKGVRYDLNRFENWLKAGGHKLAGREWTIDDGIFPDSSIVFLPEMLRIAAVSDEGVSLCETTLDAMFDSVTYDEHKFTETEKQRLVATLRLWADRFETLPVGP